MSDTLVRSLSAAGAVRNRSGLGVMRPDGQIRPEASPFLLSLETLVCFCWGP